MNIESWTTFDAELPLNNTGRCRENLVWSGRAENDEVDIVRTDPRRLHRALRRYQAHGRRGLVVSGKVATLYPGSLSNPFIRGVHGLFEVLVGYHFFREEAADPGDACIRHGSFLSRNAAISRNVG